MTMGKYTKFELLLSALATAAVLVILSLRLGLLTAAGPFFHPHSRGLVNC